MRLRNFILENMEPILWQCENFARDAWPDASPRSPDLRDYAYDMLHAISDDMQATRSDRERHEKSVGNGCLSPTSENFISASARHAIDRLELGFEIRPLVAEYRALRSSVLHLWSQAFPDMDATQIHDMTMFNECMDMLLTKLVISYSESVANSRELFLGILGHDLRSPLCAVSIIASLLEENEDLSDPSRHMASRIVIGAREMKQLVDDLLDFAGSHLGEKMHITRHTMSLEELCREVIEEIQAAHPTRVFNLEISGDGNGEWDRSRLRQLMSNLLVNSIQHGAAESPIRLFIKADGHMVELGVCNHGPRIPPALQAAMFDPLRRSSCNGALRDRGGLGLGLHISQEVVKAHGGSIVVNSNDRETAFIVKLPQGDTCGTHSDAETTTHDSTSVLRSSVMKTSVA